MNRRAFYLLALFPLLARSAETLPNGIVLPDAWPPRVNQLTREPLATPPYLIAPPAVIPIDVGRQLFVDDFLIEKSTLTRTFHQPEYHAANPLIRPDKPWEGTGARARAAMFSDGVWFDPADKLFKLWYWAGAKVGSSGVTCMATSRDGFYWTRPDRRPFCGVSEKKEDWNWGNVQSAGGCCLIVGDKLHFYVGGVGGSTPQWHPDPRYVGLATLRRDGFASLDANASEGVLTTRPVKFSGKHLFVNLAAPQGELRAEVLDQDGNVIAPFTKENCFAATGDKTLLKVNWKDGADLSKLAGQTVRIRFTLMNGSLYAFSVSPDASGASHGFVAAGGPGFTGATDTVGTNPNRTPGK